MTSWKDIENELRNDLQDIHRHIRNLAPQDSSYKGFYKGMLVDYIIVNNNPVYTNTNNLYNSVELRYKGDLQKGGEIEVFVSGSRVPYYERAVLRPELRTIITQGQRDYGDNAKIIPYVSVEDWVDNENYMYYMRAESFVKSVIGKWNGREYRVKERMDEFK